MYSRNTETQGAIYALSLVGYNNCEIRDEVTKPDGEAPSKNAVRNAINLVGAMGGFAWDGASGGPHAGGRPPTVSRSLQKQLVKAVFKHRGSSKVVAPISPSLYYNGQ